MKTALTELIERLEEKRDLFPVNGTLGQRQSRGCYVDAILIAKSFTTMEKQQIIEAHNKGVLTPDRDFVGSFIGDCRNGENYFTSTFNNQ